MVWIGLDDGTPLGLSDARAALPIWTDFMRAAAGLEDPGEFAVPPAMVFRQVWGSTFQAVFLRLTEPGEACEVVGPAGPAGAVGAAGPPSLSMTGLRDR